MFFAYYLFNIFKPYKLKWSQSYSRVGLTVTQDVRRKQIVEFVEGVGKLSSNEIRKKMKVSEKTIRDDLAYLLEEGKLLKGYVCADYSLEDMEKVYYFTSNLKRNMALLGMESFSNLPIYILES